MKRKMAVVLCLATLLGIAGSAFASVGFTNFKLVFVTTTTYKNVTSDTTSTAKDAGTDYARLYVYSTTSSKNNVYRTYSGGQYVSGQYFKKLTDGTWMYYTSDIAEGTRVYLKGRPDSSVSSCYVTGEFGAG